MAFIAIVDAERDIVASLRMALQAEGHIVDGYTDPLVALPKVILVPPQVLILSRRMPGLNGIEFFLRYREFSRAPVMFLSGSIDLIEAELNERGMPADAYVEKPFSQRHIVGVIKDLLRAECSKRRAGF